jgi:hypothetical protein
MKEDYLIDEVCAAAIDQTRETIQNAAHKSKRNNPRSDD